MHYPMGIVIAAMLCASPPAPASGEDFAVKAMGALHAAILRGDSQVVAQHIHSLGFFCGEAVVPRDEIARDLRAQSGKWYRFFFGPSDAFQGTSYREFVKANQDTALKFSRQESLRGKRFSVGYCRKGGSCFSPIDLIIDDHGEWWIGGETGCT